MSTGNSASYINDEDQNRIVFNSLFSFSSSPRTAKPYSKRNLPDSFYRPPSVNTKNKNVHRQHTKNQLSLPDATMPRTPAQNCYHSRRVSDTAVLIEQNAMDARLSQINSQSTVLPLPDDWEEKRTSDGQVYYIDHRTQYTTWDDPRPKHYAAFQSHCSTLPLPDGFGQTYDSKGNVYYIDHQNQKTYWEDPRPNFYRSLMTKRLDTASSMASPAQEDLLSNKLTEIFLERKALQLRAQELERMEADIRQRIDQRGHTDDQSLIDQTTLESLVDDLLLHSRQNSTDSGLDDGRCSVNQINDGLDSLDFLDPLLFSNSPSVPSFPTINDARSKNQSAEQNHQRRSNTNF